MVASATIRVFPETRARIKQLSVRTQKSAAQIVDELVTAAEEQAMIAEFNAYFEDASRAIEFHASETAALDATLADGLDDLA